jgi:hypothetical protein
VVEGWGLGAGVGEGVTVAVGDAETDGAAVVVGDGLGWRACWGGPVTRSAIVTALRRTSPAAMATAQGRCALNS